MARARKGWKNTKSHTHTHTHCKCMCTNWVCWYSEAAKEDEEQAFFKWGVEINSSIYSLPASRLAGAPICDAALHTSFTAAGISSPLHSFQREPNLIHHFYFSFYGDPDLQYDWASQVSRKSVCLMQTTTFLHYYVPFYYLIWCRFSASLSVWLISLTCKTLVRFISLHKNYRPLSRSRSLWKRKRGRLECKATANIQANNPSSGRPRRRREKGKMVAARVKGGGRQHAILRAGMKLRD